METSASFEARSAPLPYPTAPRIHGKLGKNSAFHPLSIVAAVAVLSLAAALAGFLPARRAASIDFMVALRTE